MLLMATWRCLMLPGAKDRDLLRSRRLFAPELISLTVFGGEAQQIELALLVHLKLDKSDCRDARSDYGPESAGLHKAGDEDVAVPGRELQLGAGRLKLHDERLAVRRHRRLAEARIDEMAGERCERWERPRTGRFGEQLRRFLEAGFRFLELLRHVIDFRVAQNPVQNPQPEHIRTPHIPFVSNEDDADLPVRLHADIRTEATRASIVPDDVAILRLGN